MVIKYKDIELDVAESQDHEWILETALVAQGYGVTEEAIRSHKSRKGSELVEGKHFVTVANCNGGEAKVFWTKRGVVRLGFFLKSKQAAAFRDWAEDLVLRQIIQQSPVQLSRKELALMVVQIEEEKEALEQKLAIAQPKAEYVDEVLGTSDCMVTTVVANEFGYSAVTFNKLLKEKGVQWKVDGVWVLTSKYASKGYAQMRTGTYNDSSGVLHTKLYLVWTQKGRAMLHELFKRSLVVQ